MPHWIIDSTLKRREGSYAVLIDQLEHLGIPHTFIRKIPFADYLIDDAGEKMVLEPIDGPVFVSGTLSMRSIAHQHGWCPGYIDAPGQSELIAHWGDEVLNADAVIAPLKDAEPIANEFFARPVEDTKSFSGQIFQHDEFIQWRDGVLRVDDDLGTIASDDLIVMAPLKTIYAEYRLFVIGGRVVTGSSYKVGSQIVYSNLIDPDVIKYAQARIAEYCPRRAICLDIAVCDGGMKVIETNSISSSGFYASDMNVFVGEIEREFG